MFYLIKKKYIKKISVLIIVTFSCLGAFALPVQLAKNLQAFRKYEPDFISCINQLEEIIRKVNVKSAQNQLDKQLLSYAKERTALLNSYIQKRYNLLDDIYKSSLTDYPNFKSDIIIGFSRIEELYQKFTSKLDNLNNIIMSLSKNQTNQIPEKFSDTEIKKSSSHEIIDKKQKSAYKNELKSVSSSENIASQVSINQMTVETEENTREKNIDYRAKEYVKSKEDYEKDEEKTKISGSFKIGLMNRNEEYTSRNESLPNNINSFWLTLSKKLSSKENLIIDEKFIHRKRNEIVNENHLNLAYLNQLSNLTNLSIKNKTSHFWYPENAAKSYRNNLSEISVSKKYKKFEELYSFGYENQIYPDFSRSDFTQRNLNYQYTYFVPNGTFYAETSFVYRKYKNVGDLDYKDNNFIVEFNRHYDGNNSDISISNSYNQRFYENESLPLFRTSYWDNYFRFYYYLPVSKIWQWIFENEYLKRNYYIDEPRGYQQLKFKTLGRFEIDDDSKATIRHEYIFNDENTKNKSHKNHIWNACYEKRFNKNYKLKIEDNFHVRYSLESGVMNFNENSINIYNSFQINDFYEITLKLEYLLRMYLEHFYSDYKTFTTGLNINYTNSKDINSSLEIARRKFSYRNGNRIATDWFEHYQPVAAYNLSYKLSDDKRLKFRYLYDKTFYKSFDSQSQELLWDFTKPMIIREFYGGIEYYF